MKTELDVFNSLSNELMSIDGITKVIKFQEMGKEVNKLGYGKWCLVDFLDKSDVVINGKRRINFLIHLISKEIDDNSNSLYELDEKVRSVLNGFSDDVVTSCVYNSSSYIIKEGKWDCWTKFLRFKLTFSTGG